MRFKTYNIEGQGIDRDQYVLILVLRLYSWGPESSGSNLESSHATDIVNKTLAY